MEKIGNTSTNFTKTSPTDFNRTNMTDGKFNKTKTIFKPPIQQALSNFNEVVLLI